MAQSLRQRNVTLAVVQSVDNAAEWQQITARLAALGAAYRSIAWEQVRQANDLEPATVLFLPNVETITAEQLLALESWMGSGGRLIVSGAIGTQSEFGVRQALRSLLGAYWAVPLSEPSAVQPVTGRTATAQRWLQQGEVTERVGGGVLVPVGLSSQAVATWRDAPPIVRLNTPEVTNGAFIAAAIVTTERTTFLGWQWGESGSASFDQVWLQAAIARYGNLSTDPTIAAAPPARSPAAPPPPNRPSRPPLSPNPPSQDPAEQVAPAGLEVDRSARPITTMELIAMRQELENLIGRFESALLSADSVNSPTSLAAVESGTATLNDKSPAVQTASAGGVAIDADAAQPDSATVAEARRILEAFPQLVARREYAAARQQWLHAREILWQNFPVDRPSAQPEIRAMWLDRGTIVRARSRQGLERIFDRLAAAGINTVFFETVNAGYPIYPSRIAPQQNPQTRGWDPLADAVELAHDRGIELHAWVWTFAAGNRAHNTLLNLPADHPGPVISAHRDWANYDNTGSMIPPGQGKPFLDPANPEVRRYLLSLFDEIITRYDVDGLQLDYIRYPFQDPGAGRTYGYGLAARQQFQRLAGVDPITLTPNSPQWQRWTQFRTEQINSFVADTARLLRQRRDDLILSTAVFALSEHERVQKIQQNWEVWAQRGDVDLIVTMSYAMDTTSFLRLASPWLSHRDLGSALVLPSIRLLNLSEAATVDQIQALRDLPAGGYSLFAVENLNHSLQTIFDRTQGNAARQPIAEPIPYRQPFAAAAGRYDALEREWSYLLGNGQLWMREAQVAQWRSQAEALGEALTQLAERPSPQRLEHARTLLRSFRAEFDDWMYLHALNESYRVRTWQNRLATLETLLNYGERVVLQRAGSANQ
jgi:uncharacterized lipoprotein YddW (UPF0748 family)